MNTLPTVFREVRDYVLALRTAATARGQLLAQVLDILRELRIDLQALASTVREIHEDAVRLKTEQQKPANPVVLEILTDPWNSTTGHPKIQRRFGPFSFQGYLRAQAEALARERMKAAPDPLHDVD